MGFSGGEGVPIAVGMMQAVSERRPSLPGAWWLSILTAIAAVALWRLTGGFPLDDSWIVLHNARTLIEGSGTYGVRALVGATSPVHLVLVAASGLLLPLELASVALSAAAAVAYLLGVRSVTNALALDRWASAALTVGAFAGMTLYHVFNGLETGLAMAAAIWAIALALRGPSNALAALLGVMPFIRPELGLLSLLVGAALIRRWRRHHVGVAVLAAAPFAVWMLAATGSVVPSTAEAKVAFFATAGLPFAEKVDMTLELLVESSVGIVILAGIVGRGRLMWPIRLFIVGVVGVYVWQLPDGFFGNRGRYLYVLLPAALLGVGYLMRGRFRLPVMAAVVTWTLVAVPFAINVYMVDTEMMVDRSTSMAAWVNRNLPSDARLLIHDAGYVAWATDFQLIDVVGLKRPSSVDAHERWTAPTFGKERYKAVGEIAEDATHAVVLNAPPWSALAEDLEIAGYQPVLLHEDPDGFSVYHLPRARHRCRLRGSNLRDDLYQRTVRRGVVEERPHVVECGADGVAGSEWFHASPENKDHG